MDTLNYKYFETFSRSCAPQVPGDSKYSSNGNIEQQNLLALTTMPDPSLQASTFWRIFPHLAGLFVLWPVCSFYFNSNIWIFYPIIYSLFMLLLIFIFLFQSKFFEHSCIAPLFNTLSFSLWFYIVFWLALSIINSNLFSIFNINDEDNNKNDTQKQIEIVLIALFLTSMVEQIFSCYLCHRVFDRYFANGTVDTSINCLILYCAMVGMAIAIGKAIISLCLLGHSGSNNLGQGFFNDYQYALLDYSVIPFIVHNKDGTEHEWVFVLMASTINVLFHTSVGVLWGVSFVRRYVLEHSLAFSQMLMFPWFAHWSTNLILAEVYYNVCYPAFSDRAVYLGVSIGVPSFFIIFNCVAFVALYRRTVDPVINRIQSANGFCL